MEKKGFKATHRVVEENRLGMIHGLPVGTELMYDGVMDGLDDTDWYINKDGWVFFLNRESVAPIERSPIILIVGHGLHGKDTLAEILTKEFGLKFRGSSQVASEEVIYPALKNFYQSAEDAFSDRRNNRELWASLIRDFNRDDKSRLAKLVCEGGYGYTGLREKEEVEECLRQGIFTHVIWVNRPDLPENDPTMTFSFTDLFAMKETYKNFSLAYFSNNGLKEIVEERRLNALSRVLKIKRV